MKYTNWIKVGKNTLYRSTFILALAITNSIIPLKAQIEKIQEVERSLSPGFRLNSQATFTVKERMEHYQVPGLSMAVLSEGKVDWVKSYGSLNINGSKEVSEHTIFQAASISKTFTAVLALAIEQSGLISINEPVNKYLLGWQLQSTRNYDTNVSISMLLAHTAGTNVHGTPGYLENEQVPDLTSLLNGSPPSKSPKVVIDRKPGSRYRYSGGGYWVIQKALEDVTGKSFQELMEEYIFSPLGMSNSSFNHMKVTDISDNHAYGHQNGKVRGTGFRRYAGLASGGLYTTSHDLALFAQELIQAFNGQGKILSKSQATKLTTKLSDANYGLGVILSKPGDELYLEHGGVNPGFSGLLTVLPYEQKGFVVLTNTEYPIEITTEIRNAVATVYGWGVLQPEMLRISTNKTKLSENYIGKYERVGEPNVFMEIENKEGEYFIHLNTLKNPMHDPLYDNLQLLEDGRFLLEKYGAILSFPEDGSAAFDLHYLESGEVVRHTK